VTYCDIQGGWLGTGNINADPRFRDPDGPDGDPQTFADNDYHLSTGSPCIDAGSNLLVPVDSHDLDGDGDTAERTPIDLDDDPRFADDPMTDDTGVQDLPDYPWVVDMGAFEYQHLQAWSVAIHAAAGAFSGGEVALPIHPGHGVTEPRAQDSPAMFFRLAFIEDAAPGDFTVHVSPDPGLTPALSPGAAGNQLHLAFDGVFPTGRFEITLDSTTHGICSFPICFAQGDVNCDGATTGLDIAAIQSAGNWRHRLSEGADPRADINRDGQVTALDLAQARSPMHWNQPDPPLMCQCR
jgi:hypothetical protein